MEKAADSWVRGWALAVSLKTWMLTAVRAGLGSPFGKKFSIHIEFPLNEDVPCYFQLQG